MKKTVLMLAVAGMTMAACTNSEVLDSATEAQTGKITFNTHVNKPTTKANLSTETLDKFWVSGYYTHTAAGSSNIQVFNKAQVSKEGDNWKMTDERYWLKDAKYHFFAYSDGGSSYDNANFNLADGKLVVVDYEVNPQSHDKDLIFAATEEITGKESGNEKVALTFRHLLTKIQFTFKNRFTGDYKINISDLKIEGIRSKASYNQAAAPGQWTFGDNTRVVATLPIEGDAINGNGSAEEDKIVTTGFKYVLPRAYEQADVKISFKFDVYPKSNDGSWSSTPIYGNTLYTSLKPNWSVGSQYNYNVELAGGAATGLEKIEFTVTKVDEWGNVTEITEGLNFSTTISE